jgi:hypothetical protein
MIILPKFKAAPPITEEDAKTIAIDGLHHAVYATTAGIVYDLLDAGSQNQRRIDKLVNILKVKGIVKKL